MLQGIIVAGATLYRGASLLKKGYKYAEPIVKKHGKATWKDIKKTFKAYKTAATKTAKGTPLYKSGGYVKSGVSKTKLREGEKSLLYYNKPKPILTPGGRHSTRGGKPQYTAETLNLDKSRKMAEIAHKKKMLEYAGVGKTPGKAGNPLQWSKEGKTVGKIGLLGGTGLFAFSGEDTNTTLEDPTYKGVNAGKDKTIKNNEHKLDSGNNTETPARVESPEYNEQISGDSSTEQIVIPSMDGRTNVKVIPKKMNKQAYSQYFVGRDAPNEAYRKIQSGSLKRYNPQNLQAKRQKLRTA